MMDLLLATSGGEAQAASGGYVDDIFSAYTYTGNGTSQTINNGIDLAGNGGLVWIKGRNAGAGYHRLFDTSRGATNYLDTATSTSQSIDDTSLMAFSSNGFSLSSAINVNRSGGYNYASWTFRRAPKFFDVVTYTGNGSTQNIGHSLGTTPGMVIFKKTSYIEDWFVMHRSLSTNQYIVLNLTAAATTGWTTTVSDTTINFASGSLNNSGQTYIAYLFAHDPSADGIIQCGSFATDASGNATVNLGWANGSQFAMIKAASTTGDWEMYDTARTSAWSGNDARLRANLSNAEDSVARISASGTSITFAGLSANSTYIYTVVRSPS